MNLNRLPRHADPGRVLAERAEGSRSDRRPAGADPHKEFGSCSRRSTCCRALTRLHNVELRLIYAGMAAKQRRERAAPR